MHTIDIYRGGQLLATVKPDENSVQSKAIMGDNTLQLYFSMNTLINFRPGDQATVFGEMYQVRQQPAVTKRGSQTFNYTMTLVAQWQELSGIQFLFLGDDNTLKESDFSLMGNAQTFLNLLLQNVSRVAAGYTSGQVDTTGGYKNISFSKDNCLSALAKITEAFSLEWFIESKKINLTSLSHDTGITFRHGQRKGLYQIDRMPADNSSVITRLYVFGGTRNLPTDYGSSRLRMKLLNSFTISGVTCVVTDNGNGTSDFELSWTAPSAPGVTALTIQYRRVGESAWTNNTAGFVGPRTLTLPSGAYEFVFVSNPSGAATPAITVAGSISVPQITGDSQPFIEKNTAQYGVIEYTEVFDDIYPHRTGVVSATNALDPYQFFDTSIDFDINAQLLPGQAAKVVFNTGQLAGYQFEISSFDPALKRFRILKNKDETSLDIPSDNFRPAIGDKYVLIDIKMPQTYIDAAEKELYLKAQDLLTKISQPQYQYSIVIDPVFVRTKNYRANIGDLVWITDDDFELNRRIRVQSLTRNIVKEDEYQIVLSDDVSQGTISQINNNISAAQQGVNNLQSQLQNAAINNGKVIGNLRFEQGTAVLPDMPSTADTTGFEQVYRKISTGELFRKV